mgnify:FL=1|tara:strand:- start:962 stop:1351 length:390 start_codon:yes stop_codon:yes gene_type:complete
MKYIYRIANLLVWLIFIASPAQGQGIDYTMRNYTTQSCELFANDAYYAAGSFKRGVVLQEILETINDVSAADSMKHRAFQAVQLVWRNQLDNPTLAYSLAMGLCLKPKKEMAPIDEPSARALRTSKEFF